MDIRLMERAMMRNLPEYLKSDPVPNMTYHPVFVAEAKARDMTLRELLIEKTIRTDKLVENME
jgi:hypothetical protein